MFGKNKFKKSLRQILLISLTLGLLSGCATSLVVKGDFPEPLIDPIPITAKLIYTDEFKNYTYLEESKTRSLNSIDFGSAQVNLFNTVFNTLLTVVQEDAELTIAAENLDFQFTIPRETKLNLYEVWLKYRVKITDSQGAELADWVIKGYGKTPTATLKSPTAAFNSATIIALRDVGAQIAIGFPKQPAIVELLNNRQNSL